MASGMLDIMKRAALDAVDDAKLTDLRFGTVTSASPLKIRITNQFVLTEQMLIVPEHLTDHEVEVTITNGHSWKTQKREGGTEEDAFESHDHDIVITKQKMKLHQALKVDDRVVLLRKQGGQIYYILDRLPKQQEGD